MLQLQVAGFPLRVYRLFHARLEELANALPARATIRFSPSLHQELPQIGTGEQRQIRQNIQDGFTHIAAPPCRDFTSLYNAFQFDCRIIRLNVVDILRSGWDEIQAAVLTALDYEERWSRAVKPADIHSPLLLPPPSFYPVRRLVDFWKQCDCYRDTSKINIANNLIQAVRSEHRRGKKGLAGHWVDAGERKFMGAKALHGHTPEERTGVKRFRFCYRVPLGFHFDVTHERSQRFAVLGRTNQEYKNITRANIDSWGSIRNVIY